MGLTLRPKHVKGPTAAGGTSISAAGLGADGDVGPPV